MCLEQSSHYLVEFKHQKFDDVEVPGQYLQVCWSFRSIYILSDFVFIVEG
jgi:hypothetical protein